MRTRAAYAIAALTAAFLGVFFFWPLAKVLQGGLLADGRPTLAFVAEVFRNPLTREGLRNSFLLAVLTTSLVVVMTLPLAVLGARCDFPGKTWLTGLILAPMILPPFVGALGIRQVLGQCGALNALLVKLGFMDWSAAVDWLGQGRFLAVAVTEALHLYPIFYLNAVAALANVDPALEEAARNLGCRGWTLFRRITLPLILPGLFAGATLVFLWSFTELGTPLMFDFTRVTPVQIYDGVKEIGGSPFPYALVIVMLAVSLLLYGLARLALGRRHAAMTGKGMQASAARPLPRWAGAAAAAAFLAVFLLAAIPHAGVLLTSVSRAWYGSILPTAWTLNHYAEALGHGMTLSSIRNSLAYAGAAVAVDMVLGVAIAYVVTRSALRWRGWLDAAAMLPLAVPGIVLAFGYLAMSRPGAALAFLDPVENPAALLIIAYAIRRLPYVVRAAAAGLDQVSTALEEAAQNLGCPPLRAACRITLPLIAANLLAGGLLAFSFAMLEVSDSLMLAQKEAFFPITKALFELSQLLGEGRFIACALGVWAMVFLVLTILLANTLLGKKLGALFRL
jgi:iron(III) transport system permease protein